MHITKTVEVELRCHATALIRLVENDVKYLKRTVPPQIMRRKFLKYES